MRYINLSFTSLLNCLQVRCTDIFEAVMYIKATKDVTTTTNTTTINYYY